LSTTEASAIVCDRGVRWRRRSGDRRPTRWAMPQKNAASMMRQSDKGAATMIKQPRLAPSPQPRPAPTARALPSRPAAQRGQNWTPIRGQFWTPIDNFYWKALAGWSDELIETAIAAA